jgi:small-conductance mechanosensitive channel
MNDKDQVEQLKNEEAVRTALRQTAGTKEQEPKPAPRLLDRLWFLIYVLLLVAVAALYYLLNSGFFSLPAAYMPGIRRALIGGAAILLILAAARAMLVYWIHPIEAMPSRYNLTRVLNLVSSLAVVMVGLSVFSVTWYTALVSFGILSLILGFALQTPITSFIGWVYLLARQPYRVGDRIKIGEAQGDVIDVSYLDTTLWEYGGPYLSTQHPSGRIIKFPNSLVLNQTVYNLSWPLFPYIWNEIKFPIAYDSDLDFVAQTMREVVEQELGEEMKERVRVYRRLLEKTPIDALDIQEQPVIHFRSSENTWLEAIVRYVVFPKESGRVKTRLMRKLLKRLNEEPERVKFPRSNLR